MGRFSTSPRDQAGGEELEIIFELAGEALPSHPEEGHYKMAVCWKRTDIIGAHLF